MHEQTKAAFSTATEVVKNILTLATGLLALSVTFTKELNPKPSNLQVWVLESSWTFLLLSITAGVLTQLALAGTIARVSPLTGGDIYRKNIQVPMIAHFLGFLFGLILTAVYGMLSV